MPTPDETTLDDEGLLTIDTENEREKKYKELQADYTRKSQELASLKKQPEPQEENEDDARKNLDAELAKRGYVKKDVIDSIQTRLQQDQEFNKLMDLEPELKKFSGAIKKIAETEGLSYEDVITKYDFASQDRLAKAKERTLVGSNKIDSKPKSIDDMTPEERKKYKESVMSSTSNFSEISKF